MVKTCTKCGLEKDLDGFEPKRNVCKKCRQERRKSNQTHRQWKYRTKYNITLEEYDELLNKQGGHCWICPATTNGNRRFVVDHNHDTGEVRGLLCTNCNRALGYFQDNPDIVARGFVYLHLNGHYGKTSEGD